MPSAIINALVSELSSDYLVITPSNDTSNNFWTVICDFRNSCGIYVTMYGGGVIYYLPVNEEFLKNHFEKEVGLIIDDDRVYGRHLGKALRSELEVILGKNKTEIVIRLKYSLGSSFLSGDLKIQLLADNLPTPVILMVTGLVDHIHANYKYTCPTSKIIINARNTSSGIATREDEALDLMDNMPDENTADEHSGNKTNGEKKVMGKPKRRKLGGVNIVPIG